LHEGSKTEWSFTSLDDAMLLAVVDAITPAQSADLDRVLDGHQVECASRPGRKLPRGVVDETKLQQLLNEAERIGRPDLVAAIHVSNGCAFRSQDIESVEACDVDFEASVVSVPRKDRVVKKAYLGDLDERIISTIEAEHHLRTLLRADPSGKLSPRWDRKEANKFVQAVASKYSWSKRLRWAGFHSVGRHGAAVRVKKAVVEAVKR